MGKALPFGAVWEQAVLYLGKLGTALKGKEFTAAHLLEVGFALVIGVCSSLNLLKCNVSKLTRHCKGRDDRRRPGLLQHLPPPFKEVPGPASCPWNFLLALQALDRR